MKIIVKWFKELFPLLPSALAVALVAAVLITSQPEPVVVNAYNPDPIKIAEVTQAPESKAKKKSKKPAFEKKELPQKSAAASGGGQKQAPVAFSEGGTYKDGSYTGSARGFGGTVGVKVTIKDGKITAIDVTQAFGETSSYFARAKGVLQKIIRKQSPNVDVVSGATYSSNGLINATKNALNKARTDGKKEETKEEESTTESSKAKESKKDKPKKDKPVTPPEDGFKDGTYSGSGEGFGGPIKVKVTIKKGKIKTIEIVSSKYETPEFFNNAKKILPSIISAQSTDVDTISGATFSSEGILEAVNNALKKAERKPSTGKEESKKETEKEKESKTKKETETESVEETETTGPEESESSDSGENPEESAEESEAESSPVETEAAKQIYKDGTFTGSDTCQNYNYKVTATVVIEKDVIKSVTITTSDGGSNEGYISYAVNGLTKRGKHVPGVPEQIVDKQSTSGIDAVSGATYTSKAIIKAVNAALNSAKN